jgi:hypothetical protein
VLTIVLHAGCVPMLALERGHVVVQVFVYIGMCYRVRRFVYTFVQVHPLCNIIKSLVQRTIYMSFTYVLLSARGANTQVVCC